MPSSNIYGIDFYKVGQWLLPKHLRQTRIVILLKAMLYPLFFVIDSFSRYRQAKLYQLLITAQVCYLERLLNDRYDSTLRRIVIGDAVWHLPWWLYQDAEEKPEWFFTDGENSPVWLYQDGEAGAAKDDFTVLVPSGISFNEDEMKSLLDTYKLFGTHYKIVLV